MKKGIPKFVYLAECLKKEILRCNPGDRFYTQHEVMEKYGFSCATVTHAMQELTALGMLTRKTGEGTFVLSPVPRDKDAGKLPELTLMLPYPGSLLGINQLSWFISAQVQQSVTNHYPGHCRVCSEGEFLKLLEQNQVRISILMNPQPGMVEKLRQQSIPYVIIGQNQHHWISNSIYINHMSGVLEAVNYLHRELHHRKIALISADNAAHADRIGAFRIALQTLQLPLPENYIVYASAGNPAEGASAMKKLLSLPAPPTAVLADTDQKAFGALDYLHQVHIQIPEAMSLIGFDDLPECNQTDPPLTSISCSFQEIGIIAVDMLNELTASGRSEIRNRTYLTSLVIRRSCAVCRQADPARISQ